MRRPGEPILLREIFRGRVWAARPATLVSDDGDLVAVYLPPGMRWMRPVHARRGERLRMPASERALEQTTWTPGRGCCT